MPDDFQDKLNSILSNPEMMKTISALANSLGHQSESASEPVDDFSVVEGSTAPDLSSVISGLDLASDSRINLLNALRPYMRSNRAAHMDTAIRILKLTKLTSLLKDI